MLLQVAGTLCRTSKPSCRLQGHFVARQNLPASGERAEARADGSVPELRKAAADLLCQCAKRVNALYMITPSEDVAKVIKAAYGVVEQYKHVAAQPAKHKGGDDPEPEPAPEAAK